MSDFLNVLVLFIVLLFLAGAIKYMSPGSRARRRVRHDVLARIFSESPAHHVESIEIVSCDGFYKFDVDYIAASADQLVARSVRGTHCGKKFLDWRVEVGQDVSAEFLAKAHGVGGA